MRFHDRPRLPRGFRCAAVHCGIKADGEDLALFVSSREAAAAALFTRNHFPGAPVRVGREVIRAGRLRGVVVNSGNSNVATGPEGIARARRMAAKAEEALGVGSGLVLPSSTGVIGRPLPIERVERGIDRAAAELQTDPLVGARGMMTTDTHPKALSCSVGEATLTWVAKGSGMISPHLATMLVYVLTDARLEPGELDAHLRGAVRVSFNMLSVDSDTSTSDTCAALANGLAGPVDPDGFRRALVDGSIRMAETLARDGEGATRLLRVIVKGAASEEEARRVARSLVDSPLIKTMVHGGEPNVGRVAMAVGKCFDCAVDPDRFSAWIGGEPVFRSGTPTAFDPGRIRSLLLEDPVDLSVDLGVGDEIARAYGCDLSVGYIEENTGYLPS